MYDFHYSYIKPTFQDQLHLNYTEKDSFIYIIRTEDISDNVTEKFDTLKYNIHICKLPRVNKKSTWYDEG